jgi:hypothetical protein
MSGESGQVAAVARQEGDRVLISLPMVGFPDGFTLRPGERVVVVRDENGLAVRPLVRSFSVDNLTEELGAKAGDATLVADDRRYSVQESTVRAEGPVTADAAGSPVPHAIFVVDPGSAEGPPQVIAIRPER